MKKTFPNYLQPGSKDCGPTCIKIISKYYGRIFSLNEIRELTETTRNGSTLLKLSDGAEKLGFRTMAANLELSQLNEVELPCILFWSDRHFVVLYKVKNGKYYISDPAIGLITYSKQDFLKCWGSFNRQKEMHFGYSLLIEPTPDFFNKPSKDENNRDLSFLSKYLFKYKSFIGQLLIGLFASAILQVIFPFLTQSIVDVGIKNQDISFIYLILFAQLSLFLGRTSIELLRNWILLHLSTRINISLISDFFVKLMKLPISFFDSRMTGDLMLRIDDHRRIEKILTSSSINLLFSAFNLIIFGFVLMYYSLDIFLVFLFGSAFYFVWILLFLKKRAIVDYKVFSQSSDEHSKVIELIDGMQTIKLNNAEKQKRWGWEKTQAKLFKLSIRALIIEQYQNAGSAFINELKNILITILSAKLVLEGEITLGMMLSISYIVGQLNSPLTQLIEFVRQLQDARISLDRLSEIHNKEDEEQVSFKSEIDFSEDIGLTFNNVSFRYKGSLRNVLDNINLKIPARKITAIVGTSGSGKTTLLKLMMKFYSPLNGEMKLGSHDFSSISPEFWRNRCGVVMQEDYIFNDTIAKNIALGSDLVDKAQLKYAVQVANIKQFIEDLPQSYNTKIGMEGQGLSLGQKQRLLIARTIYKNPDYLFFDEATSSLDANNEKTIMENLNTFFKNKTVIVIAHRLSTVKNADQIVVLDFGRIIERGTHQELIEKKGQYYNLIKNQLELGG